MVISGVYPRGCGGAYKFPILRRLWWGLSPRVRGAWDRKKHTAAIQGLSPRVRGSLDVIVQINGREGSIPAGAGSHTVPQA
jgi:hypothetical protein